MLSGLHELSLLNRCLRARLTNILRGCASVIGTGWRHATGSGIVLREDRRKGQRVMECASPRRICARLDLPRSRRRRAQSTRAGAPAATLGRLPGCVCVLRHRSVVWSDFFAPDRRGVKRRRSHFMRKARQIHIKQCTKRKGRAERTTRLGRPRGGMKVAARIGERLRGEIGRSRRPRVGDG